MSNAADRQNEIWDRLGTDERIGAINKALEGTGLQYKTEPVLAPKSDAPLMDTNEVADIFGIPREDFRRMVGLDEAGFHDWLHNTPEGRQYL
jgi:hypothetical protein